MDMLSITVLYINQLMKMSMRFRRFSFMSQKYSSWHDGKYWNVVIDTSEVQFAYGTVADTDLTTTSRIFVVLSARDNATTAQASRFGSAQLLRSPRKKGRAVRGEGP